MRTTYARAGPQEPEALQDPRRVCIVLQLGEPPGGSVRDAWALGAPRAG
jgi:hypothetical protein